MRLRDVFLIVFVLTVSLGYSQRKPKIRGSKVVINVRQDLEPFNAIELNDDLDITFKKSTDYGYSLTIDDNLVDILKFRVVDNTLSISTFYNVTSKKKMEITIYYDVLNALTMHEGKIEMEDAIVTNSLSIDTYGSSKLKLNANAGMVNLMMYENSFADLNIQSDTLNVLLKDRVDAKIYGSSNVSTVELFKNSQVKMDGSADLFNVNLYENANLKAEKLEASVINLFLEKSTSAYINANNRLNLNSKDSAKTFFYGSGRINIIDFLDTSQLNKR
ncbi:DUF2807 domain-containing protein [Cellulophaga sp. HaHaR_3_176]|uniref:GIN domain-containing protein n=1 Tax=Cellulophaga sp. HaHaR_3_176 TaxID=1942464 RepID=UPI001C1F9C76|nr:DUF2807 domain-containing protein [Cellulophaga sp. HaHaR_3_176]QWX84061.1 DUF2807 domain-containing protein [Cellulophaga sp. HaHaR_3_176]